MGGGAFSSGDAIIKENHTSLSTQISSSREDTERKAGYSNIFWKVVQEKKRKKNSFHCWFSHPEFFSPLVSLCYKMEM